MINPDLEAIRLRFSKSGRKHKPWARAKGLNPDTFEAFMLGRYLPKSGAVITRIVDELKADRLWVAQKKTTVRTAA